MPGRRPDYTVKANTGRKEGDKDILMTVGAAWSFANSDGVNVVINALPVPFDGKLVLFPAENDGQ